MPHRRLSAIPVTGRLALVVFVVLAAALLAPVAPNAVGQPSGRAVVAPSAGTGVIFEVRPAPTTAPPTQPPPTPTAQPTETAQPQPPTRSPQHGGELPVTGVGPSLLMLVLVGATLVVGGVLLRRRRSAG
ncbi:LPXTG cell wall anchor domain-containing protein [Micromonospora chokoriensis]|uniref:LPXTG-motif cell wall anchor domain-containing protein n=1 Tax=Micromonospora chokoriensis TaxID=356851 RepID=A0A1C4VMM7_9ACTN|nr:LPXTG cell wall anchor domain-containing protein [Micromonospora chokoriensis]SCE85247.1 LPXTG-motif cell wall anchor domain-containing protein [Micromonospora chokoriensis]